MKPLYCHACGSLLAKTEITSKFEVKCGHCKMINQFLLGTNYPNDRQMSELDWERAEIKRNRRREKRMVF